MWYGDYIPSWGSHPKKPLSKEEMRKIREAYAKADAITSHVRELEQKEKEKIEKKSEQKLDELFL